MHPFSYQYYSKYKVSYERTPMLLRDTLLMVMR